MNIKNWFANIKNKLKRKTPKSKEEIDNEFFNSPEYTDLCEKVFIYKDSSKVIKTSITRVEPKNAEEIRNKIIA